MSNNILPPLIDMINYCESKGYDLLPDAQTKGMKAIIILNGDTWKKGKEIYKDWITLQKEVYKKIYIKLTYGN